MNSPHKGLVMQKIFPFDDVIMNMGKAAAINALLCDDLAPLNCLAYGHVTIACNAKDCLSEMAC